jgi:hypothetical protein
MERCVEHAVFKVLVHAKGAAWHITAHVNARGRIGWKATTERSAMCLLGCMHF